MFQKIYNKINEIIRGMWLKQIRTTAMKLSSKFFSKKTHVVVLKYQQFWNLLPTGLPLSTLQTTGSYQQNAPVLGVEKIE